MVEEQNAPTLEESSSLEDVVHHEADDGAVEDTTTEPGSTVLNRPNGISPHASATSPSDTEARLEALARDRYALTEEVAELRRSLEEIQNKHDEELGRVRDQLDEAQGEKEHAESQYQNLLGKVNTIRSQLGERLKADAVCHTYAVRGMPN